MKLIWLQDSDSEFAKISEDIAQDHPLSAIDFELSIVSILDNLRAFPEAGEV